MAKKIFLSPSNQKNNKYAYGNTTEAIQCGRIASALKTALKRCGFKVRLLHYYDMPTKVHNADKWGADLYIPIHTNAYNGKVTGTRIFSYDTTGEGYKAAKAVYKYLAPVTPGTSENIKANSELYEVKYPAAPTVYCEVEFHDVYRAAKWIIENTEAIAEAICMGVCDYFGVSYKVPTNKTADKTKMFKVQVGAFKERRNAEAMLQSLKAAGFNGYIKEETT